MELISDRSVITLKIYTCDACRYCFPETSQPERCPDCGKIATRLADEIETEDYYRIQAELEEERKRFVAC